MENSRLYSGNKVNVFRFIVQTENLSPFESSWASVSGSVRVERFTTVLTGVVSLGAFLTVESLLGFHL